MQKVTVDASSPILLSKWLKDVFPAMAGGAVTVALKHKDIRVNGKRTGIDVLLQSGDEITVYIADDRLYGKPPEIVWMDGAILVAIKPPGVLSRDEGGGDMEDRVGRWLEQQGEPPDAIACHRLDSGTGGLMILARGELARAAVCEMMERGRIQKTYRCIVKGIPQPGHAVLTAYLRKDARKAWVTVLDRPAPGARTAVTEYTLLAAAGDRSLLEVALHTGRTHQIRAHMASIGHPVLGDDKYGDRQFNRLYKARRQMLWACRLDFLFTAEECPTLGALAGRSLESPAPFGEEFLLVTDTAHE